jgi:hypothetical protein
MGRRAWLAILLLLSACATFRGAPDRTDTLEKRYHYAVPEGAQWELVGEWEFPGKLNFFQHYTTSVIKVDRDYVEIYSGTLVAGCCFWPYGTRLETQSANTFFNALTGNLYVINADGSLVVRKPDGSTMNVGRTAKEDSLAKSWR